MPALRGQGNADDAETQYTVTTQWQAALYAAERHGWQLTWGDWATVLYVVLMAVLAAAVAIVIMGGV